MFGFLSGSGSVPSDRTEQSGESLQTDHQKLVREGNVRQGQPEAGFGQSRSSGHQPQRKRQRGESLN